MSNFIDVNLLKSATVKAAASKKPSPAVQRIMEKIDVVGSLPPTAQLQKPPQPHWGRIVIVATGLGGVIGGLAYWFRRTS